MGQTYEDIDSNGDKTLLDIVSIFTIDGYDGKYALATSSNDEEIVGYQMIENDDVVDLVAIEDENIINIINDMIDTLMG